MEGPEDEEIEAEANPVADAPNKRTDEAVRTRRTPEGSTATSGPEGRRKNPEDYRWLAVKCRETADTASTEQERSSLRAMAKIWELPSRPS